MTNLEKYKELAEKYYNRDEKTKNERNSFISQSGEKNMKMFFDSINEIQKKLGIEFPAAYKDYIQAACIWTLCGENNYFCYYDEKSIYEFNNIGKHKGYSSLEELKDFLVIGQDEGECSYFCDPKNLLGFGVETIWKVNRSSLGSGKEFFEIVGKDFSEFYINCVEKKDGYGNFPFRKKEIQITTPSDKYIAHLNEEICNKGDLEDTDSAIEKINTYLKKLQNSGQRIAISKFRSIHFEYLKNFESKVGNKFPYKLFYILLKIGYISYSNPNIKFGPLNASQIDLFNSGKKSIKSLKNMIVFACNERSLFANQEDTIWDLFFIDVTNQIGNGSEAIYIISENSKKLEEACYVAKDIVDLFRIFAEGEELNTTPIGKIK